MPVEEEKLVAILQETMPSISAMAMRRLRPIQSRFDIDDLGQITAMKAIANRERIETDDPEVTAHWIRKVAVNCCKQSLTSNLDCSKRSMHRESELTGREFQAPVADEFEEDLAMVKLSLLHIPPNQAKAVELRYFEMAEYSEIASSLDCSVQAARSLVSRGIAAVRNILRNQAA